MEPGEARPLRPSFRLDRREEELREQQARLEAETLRWAYLLRVKDVPAPAARLDGLTWELGGQVFTECFRDEGG